MVAVYRPSFVDSARAMLAGPAPGLQRVHELSGQTCGEGAGSTGVLARGGKEVADAWFGEQELWLSGCGFDRLAERDRNAR